MPATVLNTLSTFVQSLGEAKEELRGRVVLKCWPQMYGEAHCPPDPGPEKWEESRAQLGSHRGGEEAEADSTSRTEKRRVGTNR